MQNAAARLIFQLGPRDHVTPSLIQLHWLPVRSRVQYKLCLLMHYIHSGRASAYLMDSVQATSARTTGVKACDPPRRQITSYQDCARSLVSAPSHTLVRLPGTHCLLICAIKLSHLLSKSNSKHSSLSLHSTSTNSFYDFCNAPMCFFVMRAISNIFITITITRLRTSETPDK